ncbi:hypothetical protein NEOLI_001038 [Neolecta irregularis DAH-3]|uniref:Uncharacterized protein n=1 Tax=Neolecta irregularis (strain DAH-3) TaxID=1198029 RepID=A0A1U7LH18_NEOID|nr:hypothetical protein NEOLI_001038 [Neolecta irregularis DAH-3]|eukprot:OLL21821.1 hypothetical protein NEOLI_001038 [Neolecta irregularis DAH-3]
MLPTVKEQITKASMPAAASSPTDSHLLRPLHQVTSQDSLRISLDTLSSTLEEMDTTLISDQKSLEEEGSMIVPVV